MKTNLSYEDIKKMRRGVNAFDIYDFPFIEWAKIAIRVLNNNEILECLDLGRDDAHTRLKMPREIDTYQFWMARLLQRAIYVVPEDPAEKPSVLFFKSSDEVLELSVEETKLIEDYYNTVQEKYSPVQKLETPEDFIWLIDDIKKKRTNGNYLSSYTLRKLASYLIETLTPSQNDSGTGSTQWMYSTEKKKRKASVKPQEVEVQVIE